MTVALGDVSNNTQKTQSQHVDDKVTFYAESHKD